MKKISALLLALVMLLSLAACGGNNNSTTPTANGQNNSASTTPDNSTSNNNPSAGGAASAKDSLTICFGSDIGTLAPNGNAGGCNALLWTLYDHLWYVNDAGEFTYRLATSVEYTDDVTMLVTLRDDVYDTNGVHFTASDVLFSLDVAVNGGGNASYGGAARYLDLEACNVVDDTHVNLVLKSPNIMQQAMLQTINMVTEESFKNSPDGMITTPIGTGPYVLKDCTMGTSYTLEAKEDYWGGTPKMKTITFRSIDEAAQRINAMQAGELDAAYLESPDVASGLAIPGTTQFVCKVADSVGMIFNNDPSRLTSNKELRKAIACAIDAAAIRAVAYDNQGTIPQGFLNSGLTGWEQGHDDAAQKYDSYYAYNVDAAKAHLAASGVSEGTTLVLAITNSEIFVKTAQIIQDELKAIGLDLQIDTWDAATFNDTMDTNPERYDMALVGYSTSTGATIGMITTWVTGAANYHHWKGTAAYDQVKELADAAMVETDEAKRTEMGRQISDIMADEVPMYSYMFKTYDYVCQGGLHLAVYKDFILDFTNSYWD